MTDALALCVLHKRNRSRSALPASVILSSALESDYELHRRSARSRLQRSDLGSSTNPPRKAANRLFRALRSDSCSNLLAGIAAGALSRTVTAPLELVRIRKLSGRDNGLPLFACLTKIAREEGICALWRANLVNVLRYSPSKVRTASSFCNTLLSL